MGEHYDATRVALKLNNDLSARIKGISTIDGRGQIFWYDDFQDSINKWVLSYPTGIGGGGQSIVLSTDYPMHGSSSARLTTPVNAGFSAQIQKILPIPQ